MGKKKLNEVLRKIKLTKKLHAKRHLGKVLWGEDALAFQKRLRDEWNKYFIRYKSINLLSSYKIY